MFKSTIGFLGWLKLFISILSNRGKTTYGKENVTYLITKYIYENTLLLKNYEDAEAFVGELIEVCVPTQNWQVQRIGKNSDSGYFMPRNFEFEYVISGGIGKNNDFEYWYAQQGARVVAVDPTVEALPSPHRNIEHLKLWISSHTSARQKTINLENLIEMKQNAHKMLLKLDIEGGEYEALESSRHYLAQFDVIVIEFHEMFKLGDNCFRLRLHNILSAIRENFVSLSFSSNNWKNFIQFGSAFTPETFEVVFINNRCVPFLELATESLDLRDYRNNPRRLPIPNEPFYFPSRPK